MDRWASFCYKDATPLGSYWVVGHHFATKMRPRWGRNGSLGIILLQRCDPAGVVLGRRASFCYKDVAPLGS